MVFKEVGTGEAHVTHVAPIRFFPSVHPTVAVEHSGGEKFSSAEVTFVGFNTRMSLNMGNKIRTLVEPFITVITGKWLLPCVNPNVTLQIRRRQELFSASSA